MNSLKDYRMKELTAYMVANTIVCLLCTGAFNRILSAEIVDTLGLISTIFGSAIYGSVFYIYVYLLDSMIPGNRKDAIAWFGTHRLPGCQIFSDIRKKDRDIRFQKTVALEKYRNIYENMPSNKREQAIYQNDAWYKIYKKYRDIGSIYTSNRDYLLCRDMFISTLNIAIVYLVVVIVTYIAKGICLNSLIFWVFLAAEAILTNYSMHCKGWRFSYNVIAEDVHS